MRSQPRLPLFIAAALCVAALLVLWFRSGEEELEAEGRQLTPSPAPSRARGP